MTTDSSDDGAELPAATLEEKLVALRKAAAYNPVLGAAILVLSMVSAVLEGIGITFIMPIVEFTEDSGEAEGFLEYFVWAYDLVGVPFTLETMLAGLVAVVLLRYVTNFAVSYLRAVLDTDYKRELRRELFEALADAPVDYIDDEGSDDLLNAIITEANQAGVVVTTLVDIVETSLQGVIYLVIAFVLSPMLTVIAVVGFVVNTFLTRVVLESAYDVGDRVADANERIQTVSQAGLQGTRDVRLFTMRSELVDRMQRALDDFFDAGVRLKRNQAAMSSANQFLNAGVVFALIYLGIAVVGFGIAELGLFLFAIYRLAPVGAQLNNLVYGLNGILPHLIRVDGRIRELEDRTGPGDSGDRPITSVDRVSFDDVSFAYDDEQVLEALSIDVERSEHVALVGQSGAGKSTIVSLLARLRAPDEGEIRADGTPIGEFDIDEWRERVAVVRQSPYVFDETLRENVTVGNRDATQAEIEAACEVAQVTEFVDDLPDGYDTVIGEDGVRLSGGQKQRVAIARALLKEADVLLLDEATSDLDSHIEHDVQTGIQETATDYATISIAHRLSTVRDADRIYVLEDGRVEECGTHEELLERGGIYADLHATQTGEPATTVPRQD